MKKIKLIAACLVASCAFEYAIANSKTNSIIIHNTSVGRDTIPTTPTPMPTPTPTPNPAPPSPSPTPNPNPTPSPAPAPTPVPPSPNPAPPVR